MAEETQTTTESQQQTTSGDDGKNTAVDTTGAATQTAQTEDVEKKFTQAEVDAMFQKRLSKAVKAELKKMGSEEGEQPDVKDLQRGVEEAQRNLRFYQARDQVEDYISDKRNNANIRNVRAFCRYFKDDFTFNDEGQVTNLKDLYTRAKVETPELLGMVTGSADGAAGNGQSVVGADMNQLLRGAVGITPR